MQFSVLICGKYYIFQGSIFVKLDICHSYRAPNRPECYVKKGFENRSNLLDFDQNIALFCKKSGYFDKIIQSKCSILGSSTKLFSRSNGMEFIRWVSCFFYSEIVFLSNLKDIILWHENDNCIYTRILCLRKTAEIITNLLWIFCVFFAKNRYRQNAKNGGSFF